MQSAAYGALLLGLLAAAALVASGVGTGSTPTMRSGAQPSMMLQRVRVMGARRFQRLAEEAKYHPILNPLAHPHALRYTQAAIVEQLLDWNPLAPRSRCALRTGAQNHRCAQALRVMEGLQPGVRAGADGPHGAELL
jgi:hypothetical protein